MTHANHMNHFDETLMLKWIYLIMQQELILLNQEQNLTQYVVLKNVLTNLDKLDIGKLETSPVDLSKLSNVVKNDLIKYMHIMLR